MSKEEYFILQNEFFNQMGKLDKCAGRDNNSPEDKENFRLRAQIMFDFAQVFGNVLIKLEKGIV